MRKTIQRGKQQIIFNNLPHSTLDFGGGVIARISRIRGSQATDLNAGMVLRKIAEEARAWPEDYRPALRDDVLRDPSRFVLLDPREAEAELFPKVMWCDNQVCGRVFNFASRGARLSRVCPKCRTGRLNQMRFVTTHRCGELNPLLPPACPNCHRATDMALDTRGSERIAGFRWICRECGTTREVFAGNCRACQWPNTLLRSMGIEVHRARRTFYAQYTTLLNVPTSRFDRLLADPAWPVIVGARYLNFQELAGIPLEESVQPADSSSTSPGVSALDLDSLLQRQATGELSADAVLFELQRLRMQVKQARTGRSTEQLRNALVARSGVSISAWEHAAQEILESLLPREIGRPHALSEDAGRAQVMARARTLGLQEILVLDDFPMILAAYGYTRTEDGPRRPGSNDIVSRLNPFPVDRDHGARTPIFVDQINADALVLRLDPVEVLAWMRRNGVAPDVPPGTDSNMSANAYFVQLFNDANLRETTTSPAQRLVFGLMHTFSHFGVRQAALLSGLERTSLSEYLLPSTLTIVIYCNHRFGATIGALTSLFEQSLDEWLFAIRGAHRCVYDPVCGDSGANCHACTHLAETSCRYFNLNLSRAFLFGGNDEILGRVPVGFFFR
jgi:hypothetical protein